MIHARQNKISWVSNTVGSSETLSIFKKTCHVYNDRSRSLSLADQIKAQRQRVLPLWVRWTNAHFIEISIFFVIKMS